MQIPSAGRVFDVKLIPEFDGSSQPVVEWLEKLELVCKLSGVVDIGSVLPLLLSAGAFAVCKQLSDEDRRDVKKVKKALLAAFALDRFIAYKQFMARKLDFGESPDVFLADLRRLATLAGGISDGFLCCAFVAGLPKHIQDVLRAGVRMDDLPIGQLLARARADMAHETVVCERDTGLAAEVQASVRRVASRNQAVRCYACGGANHFARECPTRNGTMRSARPSRNKNALNFRRDQDSGPVRPAGTLAQGNESGEEACAPPTSRQ
uniref:CCHC-type domain-containing protein n=1 Tax=Trichuris muris TaxID=70415 RepID=A0A5S6Q120_TRIMR